jgi:hypothetical protein
LAISIFRTSPTPTLFDQLVIDIGAIRKEHTGKDVPVLVLAIGLNPDFLPISEFRGNLLDLPPVGLVFLSTVDAATTDTFSALVVQDLNGVTVDRSATLPENSAPETIVGMSMAASSRKWCHVQGQSRHTMATNCHRDARRSGIGVSWLAGHPSGRQ